MPSDNMLFPVDEVHEAGDCVMQCLAASKKAMHIDPRLAGGKQYWVPLRAKNLTNILQKNRCRNGVKNNKKGENHEQRQRANQ